MDKNLFFYELEGRGYTFENMTWLGNCFEDDMLNMAWEMWSSGQAAKAQVPESNALLSAAVDAVKKLGSGDFVLVPKEPTDKTIAHMINTPIDVNLLCDHADTFLSEGEAYIAYKAMIEAQEPTND